MARQRGTLELPGNIELGANQALDARTVVPTKADLTLASNFPFSYEGMQVYVLAEKKYYVLTGKPTTDVNNWSEFGTGGSGGTPTIDEVLKKGNTSEENLTVGNLYAVNANGNRTDISPAGLSMTYLYEGKDNQKDAGLIYDSVYLSHLEKQPNGTYLPVSDFAVNSDGNVEMNDAVKQGFRSVMEVPDAYDDTALVARVTALEARVEALEAKLSGYDEVTLTMTDGTDTVDKTILAKAVTPPVVETLFTIKEGVYAADGTFLGDLTYGDSGDVDVTVTNDIIRKVDTDRITQNYPTAAGFILHGVIMGQNCIPDGTSGQFEWACFKITDDINSPLVSHGTVRDWVSTLYVPATLNSAFEPWGLLATIDTVGKLPWT